MTLEFTDTKLTTNLEAVDTYNLEKVLKISTVAIDHLR